MTHARTDTVDPLSDEELAFLARFGFDSELFQSWQRAVADRSFSIENNKLHGKILAPEEGQVRDLPRRGTPERDEIDAVGRDAIQRGEFGVVILNGGMATRFGGVVKGVVEVVPGRSFLELKMHDVRRAEQQCGGRIPVYLMNSFATDEATRAHLEERDWFGFPREQVRLFTQFISLRMDPNGGVFRTDDGEISPYGPGHGDFAAAFAHSNCLSSFLQAGGRHVLLGNVDNLGARVHPGLLGMHIQQRAEVTVEVAPKWPGDIGGAPYLVDGKLQLVEQIRYPDGFDPDIVDVFNTNTFHFAAESLDRDFDLGYYYVEKQVDGREAIQIERLVGEMTRFLKSNFVRVKRTGPNTRFMPIKTPEDLESARDDIVEMFAE